MASCAWKTGSTPISRTCGRRSLIPAAWAGGWARWTATSAWAESSAFIFSPVDRKAPGGWMPARRRAGCWLPCAMPALSQASRKRRSSRSRLPTTAASPCWRGRHEACPRTCSPPTGPGCRSMSRTSPPTSPDVSAATPARGGTSSCPLIETWPPISARACHGGRDHQVSASPPSGRDDDLFRLVGDPDWLASGVRGDPDRGDGVGVEAGDVGGFAVGRDGYVLRAGADLDGLASGIGGRVDRGHLG